MRLKALTTRASIFGLIGAVAFFPTMASAQDEGVAAAAEYQEPEIVVTAQRRAEKSVDVPITITAVTSDDLVSAGANQLSDVARIAPALRFDTQANFIQPTIRGVGTAVTTSGVGGNVGIYVDGFYSSNPVAADFQLLNVQSIQVLKGPQGTLFGRNTTGGAILVTTAEPSHDTSAQIKASYARFNTLTLQAYATTGIADSLAMDIEGAYRRGDGFVDNVITPYNADVNIGVDEDHVGKFENWSVRTGLKADLSDSVSALLRYSHSETDDPTNMNTNMYVGDDIGGAGTNFPSDSYVTDPDEVALSGPSQFHSKADALQLTIKADLGFGDLTSYSQYRTENSLMVEDLDHTSIPAVLLHIGVDDETISQELLLTSKPDSKLQWTGGLFYFSAKDTWSTFFGTPTPTDPLARIPVGGSSTTTESFAAFADFTYPITPDLFLTAGGRYSHDVVKDAYFIAAFSGTKTHVPDLNGDKFTPRAVLRYKPTDNSSLYASFSMGYKAGILDVGGSTGDVVDPEDITAYEIGYKYDDRKLSFDLSAFYYDYKDLQVSLFIVKNGAPSAAVINAAKSRIYGLDAQAHYRFSDHFEVNAGGAWTHARYRDFDNAPIYTRCGSPEVPCNGPGQSFSVIPTPLNDVTMQRAPEFTGNLGARYTTDVGGGELALSGNLYYTSHFFFGPSGVQFRQGGYEVLALRAQWTDPSDRFTVAAFGDNLTNSRYRTQVQYNNYGIGNTWSAPTTYGVEVGVKF